MDPTNLNNRESKVNKKIDKRKTVTYDVKKLIDIVKNDTAKNTVYDQLVTKVNAIDCKILNKIGIVDKSESSPKTSR